jgi:hypothetical protein
MKKSKILAMLMLVAVFASAFSVATVTLSPAQFVAASAPTVIDEPTVFTTDAKSWDNGTYAQTTAQTIVLDGNVSEWTDVIPETFGGAEVYLAFDGTNVYVAVVWADAVIDDQVSMWNKTDAEDGFEALAGADDTVTVGFSLGTDYDFWTWTASNRTSNDYAYEHDGDGTPDSGNLPYEMNSYFGNFNATDFPIYDNNWDTIVDNSTIPVNTQIIGWQTNETAPSGDQTNVDIGVNHTGTHYIVEFQRTLAAPDTDDFTFDFTNNDMYFYIGVANGDDAFDLDIPVSSHLIFDGNDPAELTFDAIPAVNNESLLLQGTAYDDYEDYYVYVWIDTWADTWGSPDTVTVNRITGAWSYLLLFNEMDMPLGTNNVYIYLYEPYVGLQHINYTVEFEDVNAPQLIGLTDVADRYPTGVPGDEGYVTVTVGLSDDYDDVNYLQANLYSYKDGGIALATPMVQFYEDSSTFNANITIDPTDDYSFQHNYTYFVQAWDTTGNKYRSLDYTFFTAITIPTPGFGIIAGVFGVAIAVLFVKKLKK